MKSVGLHFRFEDSLAHLADQVVACRVPYFQFFLMPYGQRKYTQFSSGEIKQFVDQVSSTALQWFVHGSYFVNLGSEYTDVTYKRLRRELNYAQKLGAQYYVIHSGTHSRGKTRQEGIDAIARVLNKVTQTTFDCTVVLENTAHANRSMGSDLYDFRDVLCKLDHPDRVQFCIDTAHAFAYGYNLKHYKSQASFIDLVGKTIGFDHIALIHLNDINHSCGSYIDHHYITGRGTIGKKALQRFVAHEKLSDVPCLLELPPLPLHEQINVVRDVNQWL